MTGEFIEVQVRDLRPGDVCGGSGIEVLKNYGCATGERHCRLRVRYPRGVEAGCSWNAYTRIRIVRPKS